MKKIKRFFELLKEGKLFHSIKFIILKKSLYRKNLKDEEFIRKFAKYKLGKNLNLDNPQTLCEKLNWLKLHDRKEIYTTMVDKYAVKKFIADKIGKEYVIECYGVWDHFDDIDFDKLPQQFVLKCTHDSGSFFIVKDKNDFDKETARKKLEEGLKREYFKICREWPYKNVPRKIIAEKYIDSLGKPESIEYKVTCFNGKVNFITICTGIAHVEFDKRTNDSYDVDFNHQPWYVYYKNSQKQLEKPKQWDDLIYLSEKIAEGIPYLRVDFYIVNGQIYFGECTFYTWGGFMNFTPSEWDLKLGEQLKLPKIDKENKTK